MLINNNYAILLASVKEAMQYEFKKYANAYKRELVDNFIDNINAYIEGCKNKDVIKFYQMLICNDLPPSSSLSSFSSLPVGDEGIFSPSKMVSAMGS